jgi:peptide/nickel transport system permease protein
MITYLLRRLIFAALTMFLSAALVFSALLIIPGDPAEIILGLGASPQAVAALRTQLGLDQPPLTRFAWWLGSVVRGDFGQSLNYQRPVGELILARLSVSLPLALAGMLLACLIALPIGIMAARRHGTWIDPAIIALAQLGAAIPSFWLALLLILLFGVTLGWLPAGGFVPWERSPPGYLYSLALPVLALALGQVALLTRMTRAALLEVLAQDYIRTAWAKGLPSRQVVSKHALRNAMITIITSLGLSFGQVLIGAIVIEQVFALPGLGRLALIAVGTRDFPLLQGLVLVYAGTIVLINFLVDASYSLLDPRIRYA